MKLCKSACENLKDKIVEMKVVGEFFSDQINAGVLDLKSMPATGFHFIQMLYISANIDANAVVRMPKPIKEKKKKAYDSGWNNFYGALWDEDPKDEVKEEEEKKDDDLQYFMVLGDPSELQHLEIVWRIVLESEIETVTR